MSIGWISVHRNLLDSDLWLSDKFSRGQAWIDLILLANHKDGFFRCRGVQVKVSRGQCGHGAVALSKRWKWSRGKVIRFLNELENDHRIVQQKTNVTTLITIIKYREYQSKQDSKQSANGQQTDINNNDNNGNNIHHPTREAISHEFQPTMETINYARARQLPNPSDQKILDDFINTNQSSNWTSANWQSEYRKFLPKWLMKNERSKQSSGKLTAIERVRKANGLNASAISDITPYCTVVGENDNDL